MSDTKELLVKIKEALLDGRLGVENVPIADIKASVYAELDVNMNLYGTTQYSEIVNRLDSLCSSIGDYEQDIQKILIFMDAAILCLTMLPEALKSLICGEYWMYKHANELDNPEIIEVIEYIDRERDLQLLNYDFVDEYTAIKRDVFFDNSCSMSYVIHKDKRMYFPREWDEQKITDYYNSVVMEQDCRSPHSYFSKGYVVEAGDIVVDVGAAEGIFSLDVLDIAKEIYVIEAESYWVEALQQTFKNYPDKVHIVHGFVDSVSEGDRISLDDLLAGKEINYIKMDIEGYERAAINGAQKILANADKLTCAICAYHCHGDEEWLKSIFLKLGYKIDTSAGYMCPNWSIESVIDAELRRGLVFGIHKV